MQDLQNCLMKNIIPNRWWKYGFLTKSKTLYEFMHILISKIEHLYMVVVGRHCILYPSIAMYKLFDPFGLLLALFYN